MKLSNTALKEVADEIKKQAQIPLQEINIHLPDKNVTPMPALVSLKIAFNVDRFISVSLLEGLTKDELVKFLKDDIEEEVKARLKKAGIKERKFEIY